MSTTLPPTANGTASNPTSAVTRDHVAMPRAGAGRSVAERAGAEPYDGLLRRLLARREDDGDVGNVVGLTSCRRQSGVSTLAANLAIRAADHGLGPVLLVDANLPHPHLHRLLKARRTAGFAELLTCKTSLRASVQATPVVGLDLLTIGKLRVTPGSPVDPQQIDAITAQLREQYGFVIFDLPEVGSMSQSLLVARSTDAALLVIRAERVSRQAARRAVDRLMAEGINLVGTVLTDERQYLPRWLEQML